MKNFIDFESMVMFDLPDEQRIRLKERYDEIIKEFANLDEIDTNGVEPLVSVLDSHNILRDDFAEKFISREELLKNAPEQENGYYKVPAAID